MYRGAYNTLADSIYCGGRHTFKVVGLGYFVLVLARQERFKEEGAKPKCEAVGNLFNFRSLSHPGHEIDINRDLRNSNVPQLRHFDVILPKAGI